MIFFIFFPLYFFKKRSLSKKLNLNKQKNLRKGMTISAKIGVSDISPNM